ncbi:hypothetical protein SNE26_23005 [Mucilaginibacter sp. cycad4]|uniref:hypothetical protein n=1 Tax=Mucilaginibacter sp. cycad4 TaxID=3342096 RepID=UPI002AAA73CA|nr:hypothetical protein [Mucilaginibacter gossypii]WPU98886.1 hypothetical protein SNE26_23005 [Mucilaginibacter gossypii]
MDINRPFFEDSCRRIDPTHGTFVSSIVLYGDEFQNEDYIGADGCYLFDATVFPDLKKESIEEFELVEHIREAMVGIVKRSTYS